MRAKKSLGQNFLKSERALRKIIEAAELLPGETVLEIGPGRGALTERLLESGARVIAVEKDDELNKYLAEKFSVEIAGGKLNLIHGNILEFNSYDLGNYKLIANIPYNITGAILKKFLSAPFQPTLMVLLVQKEVADRVIARDGKESILSISVKAYGDPEFIETVRAGSFTPMPKVDSAILRIKNISKRFFNDLGEEAEEHFFSLVRAGFQAKRKKLSSNIREMLGKEAIQNAFEKLGLEENTRAEDISIQTWQRLAKIILNQQKGDN